MRNIKLNRLFSFKRLTRKKQELETSEVEITECYKIIDEILQEFYGKKEDNSYTEFIEEILREDSENTSETEKNIKDEYENIRKYLRQKTKRNISDEELDRLLNIDESNIKNLSIDPYMQQVIRILNQTKVARRSSDKPMMTPKSQTLLGKASSEAHLTTRGMHQEQVGDLSAEIAEYIGLNVKLARAGGKHHDDGHTNSGHTGERIATIIGRLRNCGYIVHNALSADMLISEGVIDKVLEAIEEKEIKLTPERKEEIVRDMWYLFDIMISHNGEGKDRIIRYNPNKTAEDIKRDKNRCYTNHGYDRCIIPGSKEAAIIAVADKICYVRTDLLDGVNLGILKEFNDEYLQYIGILAAKKEGKTELYDLADKVFSKEEKLESEIESMESKIKNAGIQLVLESEDGTMYPMITYKILKQLSQDAGVDPEEFVKKSRQYIAIKEMSSKVLEATKNYGKIYISKIPIEMRAEVAATMIKDVCTEDLKQYSDRKDYVGLSPAVSKAMFGIRYQNLEQIVKFTRRKFEKELLPEAEYKIHEDLKEALIKTGLIREYLSRDSEEEFELSEDELRTRKRYGLSEKLDIKGVKEPEEERRYVSTVLKKLINTRNKYKYERKTCHHFSKLFKYQPERLAEIYQNALDAVDDITYEDVRLAIANEPISSDEILGEEYVKKLERVRNEIQSRYPKGLSKEEAKIFAQELANRRKNDKEDLLASAVALEYVSGMTDGTVLEAARLKSYLTTAQIRRGYKREGEPEKELKKIGKFWSQKLDLESLGIVIYQIEEALKSKEQDGR